MKHNKLAILVQLMGEINNTQFFPYVFYFCKIKKEVNVTAILNNWC